MFEEVSTGWGIEGLMKFQSDFVYWILEPSIWWIVDIFPPLVDMSSRHLPSSSLFWRILDISSHLDDVLSSPPFVSRDVTSTSCDLK